MTVKKEPRKRGRPSEYNLALCIEVCEKVSDGQNIKTVLNSNEDYPTFKTWCNWKRENAELLHLYIRAREDKAEDIDAQIDDIIALVKQGKMDSSSARVIIDTLKWKAAKYYPKLFGDKLDVTTDGEALNNKIDVVIHPPKT